MKHTHLTPKARRAQDASRARAETRKLDTAVPMWQIALLVCAGAVVLALI